MTNYAPSISSILSPDHLAHLVIQRFGFDPATRCRILRIGVNHTYLITTTEKRFVLRVYAHNWRTELEINEELKLLVFLRERNIAVSFPIKDLKGEFILRINAIEGLRFAVLFSYAQGTTVKNPSAETCFQLGVTMARLHQQTLDKTIEERKDYSAETLVEWAFDLARNHFGASSDVMEYFKNAQTSISNEFDRIDPVVVRKGIVHLDIWQDNMKVDKDGLITIFDFDNIGNGPFFLDIGYTLMSLYRHEPEKTAYAEKRIQFIGGYRSICAISKAEERLIPYGGLAIWLHYTGIHVQRFDDFSNPFLSPDFLKYWMNMAKQWMEYHGIKI